MRRCSASCVLPPLTRLRCSLTDAAGATGRSALDRERRQGNQDRRRGMGTTGTTKMRAGIVIVALLALAAVLTLGPAATSSSGAGSLGCSAGRANAVVYWSGVASSVIVIGRAPASSAVLGGMVHGAMYDAVAAIEKGLKPFATGVTAPPGASADAAVAQAARDVLAARLPARCPPSRPPTTRSWRRSRTGSPRTAARLSAPWPQPGCWRCGSVTATTTRTSISRSRRDRACSSRSRRRRRSTRRARLRAAVHHRFTVRLPTGAAVSLTSKRYAEDVLS